jgi:hypothetical protein
MLVSVCVVSFIENHVIFGFGVPLAKQENLIESPSLKTRLLFDESISIKSSRIRGGTEK